MTLNLPKEELEVIQNYSFVIQAKAKGFKNVEEEVIKLNYLRDIDEKTVDVNMIKESEFIPISIQFLNLETILNFQLGFIE